MTAPEAPLPPARTSSPGRGAVVGALVCAFTRFLVAVSFLFYVHRWGGPMWPGTKIGYTATIISAALGLVVGAVAGITCRPLVGATLGGFLSAGSCMIFFVLPAELTIFFTEDEPHTREKIEVLGGLIAMTLAGAFAGWAGGAVGRHGRRVG